MDRGKKRIEIWNLFLSVVCVGVCVFYVWIQNDGSSKQQQQQQKTWPEKKTTTATYMYVFEEKVKKKSLMFNDKDKFKNSLPFGSWMNCEGEHTHTASPYSNAMKNLEFEMNLWIFYFVK